MAELSKAIARLMQERERTRPASTVESPQVRAVVEQLRGAVVPMDRPLVEAFARQLLDHLGPESPDGGDSTYRLALARSAYRLAADPEATEPRVRIFDPDLSGEGWGVPCTVVQTLMRDRPFIVDTVRETLREAGCSLRRIVHPVLIVERDPHGALVAVPPPGAPGQRESFVHAEVDRVGDAEALTGRLTERLQAVIAATDDYGAMRARAEELAAALRGGALARPWREYAEETAAFLDWLGQKSFVFLGYREYQFTGQGAQRAGVVRPGSGLGILRDDRRSRRATSQPLGEDLRRQLNELPLLIVSKTTAESPIHRRAHMDYIGLKEINANGMVVGERRFLGLFTAKAYAEDPAAIPLLREKLAAVIEATEAAPDSHDYKAIVRTFSEMPRVALLASSARELTVDVAGIVAAADSSEVQVLARPDALGRGVFVTVLVPRSRFSDALARRIETTLATTLDATAVLADRLLLDDSAQVRVHFYFAAPTSSLRNHPAPELRRLVSALLRTWDDRLRETVAATAPADLAPTLLNRYLPAFSEPYKAATDVSLAARDIRHLEAVRNTRCTQVAIANDSSVGAGRWTAITLYVPGPELVLSEFLPVLENLGLRVSSQDTLEVDVPDAGPVRIHTFLTQDARGTILDVATVGPLLEPALLLLHAGRVDNDRLNSLIVTARLTWRQVDLLRAYVYHGVQLGSAPSLHALVQGLVAHPGLARLLWDYFAARFDPALETSPRERATSTLAALDQQFLQGLDDVQSLPADRALRALYRQIAATLRTNYFAGAGAAENGTPSPIALKVDPRGISNAPPPEPVAEIFVHALNVAGVHLRGGAVARGGIRLSERPDDFRREILDLMKTQTVKNAVIVPAGAKGGFVVRRRADGPATAAQHEAAYRTFIGALLDVTDNIVQGGVVAAPGVRYDEADPYLVVAADKGTAGFSDLANRIAAERGFWLGDAFASGGSRGYDHKKLGITARGAWECVRRHFRELGRDADSESLTVIGIGDMGGDVFGNGLLLSRRLRLRAAFNHAHIFLDPEPDPALAFAERERLFHLPHSSWTDYNPTRLSAGGGVYARAAKRVPLSPIARQMLDLHVEHPSGEDVVAAILRMPADLLWNGGIGTYVKAGDEPHSAAEDPANDAVRIDAAALRVAVVAEGGNLGFTQRARIEFALRGGRIDTDAIDNSGGVDLSDHEVNLKLALAAAVEGGQLSLAERDRILAELVPEIVGRVLAHNGRQALVLSVDQIRSQTRLAGFRTLVAELEAGGHLDRRRDRLPDRETLRDRRATFLGLTNPELAVILAHTKLDLQQRLLASSLPDEPFAETYLRGYFPDPINRRFGQGVRSHRLRREIIAVEIANAVVDRMGTTFVTGVAHDTGAAPVTVVRAWAIAAQVADAAALWTDLVALDPPMPVPAERQCWLALEAALERAAKWVVERQASDLPATEVVTQLAAGAGDLSRIVGLLPAPPAPALLDSLAAIGVPRALAERLAALDRLADVFEVGQIARDLDLPRDLAAEAYAQGSVVIDLDWLRRAVAALPGEDRWERRAVQGLAEDVARMRRRLTHEILAHHVAGATVAECVDSYVTAHQGRIDQVRVTIDDLKSAPHASLSAVVVVVHELGRLLAGRE
ncbi:NAD-glutamate dehydrogenase [Candidatus Binatia bacterium]|nr:NAD-glutamate dehydrogenase [Candidatus Binatia bacterium]